MSLQVRLVYRDEWLVAVDKPPGLLVHRSDMDRGASDFALQQTRDLVGAHVYPAHRLDKPTSGVLVFARSQEIAGRLGRAFSERSVEKTYIAVMRGFTPDQLDIDHPVGAEGNAPREAQTRLNTLNRVELRAPVGRYASARYSLVRLHPQSGRLHQLRKHAKHIHHPILGDRKYGDDDHRRFLEGAFDVKRLLLHHESATFGHPASGDRIVMRAPLSGEMARLVGALFRA